MGNCCSCSIDNSYVTAPLTSTGTDPHQIFLSIISTRRLKNQKEGHKDSDHPNVLGKEPCEGPIPPVSVEGNK